MHSIRTNIHASLKKEFELFLYVNGMDTVSVGTWQDTYLIPFNRLCYAYKETSDDAMILTKVILQHSSIDIAFEQFQYANKDMDSCIGAIV